MTRFCHEYGAQASLQFSGLLHSPLAASCHVATVVGPGFELGAPVPVPVDAVVVEVLERVTGAAFSGICCVLIEACCDAPALPALPVVEFGLASARCHF